MYVCGGRRKGGESDRSIERGKETDAHLYTTEAMHSVEIKGGILASWARVASVVTMVARGAAKKMIVKKLQTRPS